MADRELRGIEEGRRLESRLWKLETIGKPERGMGKARNTNAQNADRFFVP
jgi:hypothetical protein